MDSIVFDDWSYWREALAAKRGVDTQPGSPRPGYYRLKGEAIAFWPEDGQIVCWRSSTQYPAPSKPDAVDELFGWCAPHPISFEDFTHFQHHGRWPDEIAPVEIPADLPPHQRADAELSAQREAMAAWVKEIGGKVATQAHADKAGNFADEFAKIERRATSSHKAEKEPHLEAGRVVDAAWKPVIGRADELKRYAKKLPESFLIAEKARIAAEERAAAEARARAAAEAERQRREAEAIGAPPPIEQPQTFAPPPQKAKAGKVHLRTVTKHEIVDMRAVIEFLARLNDHPAELKDVAQLLVNRMRHAGVEVPGVETKTIEVAA